MVEDEDYTEFDCISCGVNTLRCKEYYMIQNKLWKQVAKETRGKGMLCIGCVEDRLGRALVFEDFTQAPLNTIYWNSKSDRLKDRLMSGRITHMA